MLRNRVASEGCCCCYCCFASVVSDSVRPDRWQPTRLPCPWDSQGKNTGVGCHFLLQCMKVISESEIAQLCPTLSDPMDCSQQAPPPMGFSRQEYWSGVPSPSPIRLFSFCQVMDVLLYLMILLCISLITEEFSIRLSLCLLATFSYI